VSAVTELTVIYRVEARPHPNKSRKAVGYYQFEHVASQVVDFVKKVFSPERLYDLQVQYRKVSPADVKGIIRETLDAEEYKRLLRLNWGKRFKKEPQEEVGLSKRRILYYCLMYPNDQIIVGGYQTRNLALEAQSFFHATHPTCLLPLDVIPAIGRVTCLFSGNCLTKLPDNTTLEILGVLDKAAYQELLSFKI